MNTCLKFGFPLFTLVASAAIAAPQATVKSVAQDETTGLVKIVYDLSEAGIVTLSAETNAAGTWVRMDDANVCRTAGSFGIRQAAGTGLVGYWRPDPAVGRAVADGAIRVALTAWAYDNPPDYMVIDLLAASNVVYYATTNAMPNHNFGDANVWWSKMAMRKIPAKGVTWRMGDSSSTRRVTLTSDYYMGVTMLTVGQYNNICNGANVTTSNWKRYQPGSKPGGGSSGLGFDAFRGKVGTSGTVVWPESKRAVSATSVLGKLRAFTGVDLDLPTLAQWEYACRAGCGTKYNMGTDNTTVAQKVIVCGGKGTSPYWDGNPSSCAQCPPNHWGLYDMHGCACEWCLDWTGDCTETTDPKGPATADRTAYTRQLRGGSSNHNIANCTAYGSFVSAPNASAGFWSQIRLICPVTLTYTDAEKTPEE